MIETTSVLPSIDTEEKVAVPSGLRLWAIRFSLAGIFAVLSIVFVETAGRVFIWWTYGVPGMSYGLWEYDSELGAVHACNAYNTHTQTNNCGFRGREDVFDPKPNQSLRIVCYGGSMTFCYNLPDGETWPERLHQQLRESPGHQNDQVLNGGHICWSIGHLYRRARRELAELKPDVVVLYAGVNEATNAGFLRAAGYDLDQLQRSKELGLIAVNYDQCRATLRNSLLMRLFHYKLKSKADPAPADDAEPHGSAHSQTCRKLRPNEFEEMWEWNNYRVMLRKMISLIRENGATPVYVVECGTADAARRSNILMFSERGAELMREQGIVVCDPRPTFAEHPLNKALFYDTGVHVSAEGAELLAQQVAQTILSLPQPSSTQ